MTHIFYFFNLHSDDFFKIMHVAPKKCPSQLLKKIPVAAKKYPWQMSKIKYCGHFQMPREQVPYLNFAIIRRTLDYFVSYHIYSKGIWTSAARTVPSEWPDHFHLHSVTAPFFWENEKKWENGQNISLKNTTYTAPWRNFSHHQTILELVNRSLASRNKTME